MLIPSFILWDVGCSVYTYGSIFIIALIIWHVKRSHRGLRLGLGPNKSCTKCFRRIKQKPSDRTTRAKRTSKEEADKLQKLLSTMKSQGWLPQEGSVRRLLCPDPSCPICNAMALEIQQLLGVENKKTPSTALRPSRSFSCLEALSPSKVLADRSSELSSQHSRDISLPSRFTRSQSTDQKSTDQSAAPSTGDAVLPCDHSVPQQQQEPQGSNVFQDASGLSSSSMEEPGVPATQQKKRKKSKKLVSKNKAASEAEMDNKMTFFSHWVNPEVKCDRPEEPIVFKSEVGGKPETGQPEKSHRSFKVHAEGPGKEKPANDPKAKPLRAKRNI
ncbi:protein FAM205C isoform X2 [Grammomys surdaster]|uniref:protein FAM205C isoform X2 n=1 Tax=Grammomys surdaster TaxID=491861 RepID=UPI00109FEF72|nr:protein FAM205C isoform X2 [Grammomys surdaster]